MVEGRFGIVTFHSTSHAIQAEKACIQCGVRIKLIPVPRHVSSDCGICLRFLSEDKDTVLAALEERNVEISQVVML